MDSYTLALEGPNLVELTYDDIEKITEANFNETYHTLLNTLESYREHAIEDLKSNNYDTYAMDRLNEYKEYRDAFEVVAEYFGYDLSSAEGRDDLSGHDEYHGEYASRKRRMYDASIKRKSYGDEYDDADLPSADDVTFQPDGYPDDVTFPSHEEFAKAKTATLNPDCCGKCVPPLKDGGGGM